MKREKLEEQQKVEVERVQEELAPPPTPEPDIDPEEDLDLCADGDGDAPEENNGETTRLDAESFEVCSSIFSCSQLPLFVGDRQWRPCQ